MSLRALPMKLDIRLRYGVTFRRAFKWVQKDKVTPVVDLTGYTARLQIRSAPGVSNAPLLTLTTDLNGGLEVDAINNLVSQTITATQSKLVRRTGKIGEYDLKLYGPGNEPVYTLVAGDVYMEQSLTEDA